LVIAGSCLVKTSAQQALLSSMSGGWFKLRQLESLSKVLSLLWADPDPRAYGPYGLYMIIEKHSLNIANA
jgi:hypothetical protein